MTTRRRMVRGLAALGAVALLAVGWLVRPASGPVLATATLGPASFNMAVAASAGRAFVGPGRDGRLAVLDLDNGAILRTVTFDTSQTWFGGPATMAAVDDHAGLIFLAVSSPNSGDRIAILDASSGLPRGSIPLATGSPGYGLPDAWIATDTARRLLVVLEDSSPGRRLLIYDYGRNRLLHSVPLPATSRAAGGTGGGFFYGFRRGPFGSSTAPAPLALDAPDGRIVVGHDDGAGVDLVDLDSGRLLRSVTVASGAAAATATSSVPIPVSPAVDAHHHRIVIATGQGGAVVTLDARTGRVLRTVSAGGGATMPIVDERTGRVFVWLSTGLGVLDSLSGRLLRTLPLANSGPVALDPRSGQLYAATPGGVAELDGHSGRLLRTLPVQGGVASLAVDGARGRLFVLTGSTAGLRGRGFRGVPQGNMQLLDFDTRTGALRRTLALGAGSGRLVLAPGRARAVLLLLSDQTPLSTGVLSWLPSWLRQVVPGAAPSPIPATGASLQFAPWGPLVTYVTVLDTSRL